MSKFLTALFLATSAAFAPAQSIDSIAYDSPPTPACGTKFHLYVGQTFTATIQVTDSDPNSGAALYLMLLPDGMTHSAENPLVQFGNGVDPIVLSTTLTWKPTADQVGTHYVLFDSANLAGARLPCYYEITVSKCPPCGCTYTQGGWGSKPGCGNNPGTLLKKWFSSVYPNGVEIGVPGNAGYSAKFTSASAIEKFLPQGGKPGALKADAVNPTSTAAGVLAGQVLALELNVAFSDAGKLKCKGFGKLKLCNFKNNDLNGLTVQDILDIANGVLGGGPLPGLFSSLSQLNNLVTKLNESFDDCDISWWAWKHLCK